MNTTRSMTVRTLATGVAIAAVSLVAAAVPAAAVADVAKGKPHPTAQVIRSGAGTYEVGSAYEVTFAGLNRKYPLVIAWGDGQSTSLTTACSVKSAQRAGLMGCVETATHAFASVGDYTMTAVQNRTRVWSQDIRVKVPTPVVPAPAVLAPDWQGQMLARVNALRAAVGVDPVTLCPSLATAAGQWSQYMATNNYFDHVGPDGSTPSSRAQAAGYPLGAGENIAAGQESVDAVVEAWIHSPGHYRNMIGPGNQHAGFGYAYNPNSEFGTYWTQDFGTSIGCE